jgi:hypothetical protein
MVSGLRSRLLIGKFFCGVRLNWRFTYTASGVVLIHLVIVLKIVSSFHFVVGFSALATSSLVFN